jgi:hypothetical protein
MLALALLPSRRAIRSIPSSAWSRSPLEILTFLAVYSTSMFSLRSLVSQQDDPAGVYGFYSEQWSVVSFQLSVFGARTEAASRSIMEKLRKNLTIRQHRAEFH